MKRRQTTLFTTAALAILAGTSNAATLSFQDGVDGYAGTADTWIALATATGAGDETATNYGSDTSIKVEEDNGQSDGQGLIRFDNIFGNGVGQIALGSTITSATLSLTTVNGGFSDVPDAPGAHQMLVSWDEGTVTYDNFDTIGNTGMVSGSDYKAAADDDAGFALAKGETGVWDVTTSVAAWSAGAANNGWALIGDTNNGWDAYTSEFGTTNLRPVLTVEFIPVPEPGSLALLGLGGLLVASRRRRD